MFVSVVLGELRPSASFNIDWKGVSFTRFTFLFMFGKN